MNLIEVINNSNTTIVDVRTKEEFAKDSLSYTINIPSYCMGGISCKC